MNGASVGDEVLARPRIAGKEFGRQQVSLESIARAAGEDDVARRMGSAVGERVHVVERREVELELRSAVDAAAAAVTHGCTLERPFLMTWRNFFCPAAEARSSGEGDTVEVPTS